jgi:hypothetical protein
VPTQHLAHPPGEVRKRARGGGAMTALVVATWAAAAVAGTVVLARFHSTPGPSLAGGAGRWPEGGALPAPAGRASLLVFLHPHCPCTSATVAGLERVLAAAGSRPRDVRIVVFHPATATPAWSDGGLVERARLLPGAVVHADPGGAEAARFGAVTSGTVLAFDADGVRRFAGGVTPSRGHEGDCPGAAAVESFLRDGTPSPDTFPVFGCPILEALPAPGAARTEESHR